MVADEVDRVVSSVDDVDDAVGCAGFTQHLDQHHARAGISLGGLDDVGVAAGEGDGVHLQSVGKCCKVRSRVAVLEAGRWGLLARDLTQRGIMAGKLKGGIPAQTPSGTR